MASQRSRKFSTLLILLTLALGIPSFAQTESSASSEDKNAQVKEAKQDSSKGKKKSKKKDEDSEKKARPEESWQILSWVEGDPDAVLKYEVVIEEEVGGGYRPATTLQTEDNATRIQITPLLEPGYYRFKVITYDLISRPAKVSAWTRFRVYAAHQPEIKDVSSKANKTSTIYLEEYNDGIFTIDGRNLFQPDKNNKSLEFTDYVLLPEGGDIDSDGIVPEILETDKKNRSVTLKFNLKDLDTGDYHIVAKDASGLYTELGSKNELSVRYKKPFDLDVSGGYTCPIILKDPTFKDYMGSMVWPISATAKVTFMPFKHNWGYLGIGVTGSYTRMFYDEGNYTVDGNLITAHGLLVYQFPIRFRVKGTNQRRHAFTVELHGGAGIAYFADYQFHFPHGIDTPKLNSTDVSAIAGLSLQTYITSRIYVEAGVDGFMAFVPDMKAIYVLPQVSAGFQF
ncbi:MAG TPA: hypothetical protein DCP61_03085 [Treponema sp.]|nr:hypothetical protein [Treponema sp.]